MPQGTRQKCASRDCLYKHACKISCLILRLSITESAQLEVGQTPELFDGYFANGKLTEADSNRAGDARMGVRSFVRRLPARESTQQRNATGESEPK